MVGDAPAVRANYAAISGAFAPLWIAADKNLFSKYGLNVDFRYIAPATATQALIGKNLEIINPGGEIVEAGLNGEPVVYIAGIMNRAVMSIYAKPEIGSRADLKGKVLAVTVPGATTDFAASGFAPAGAFDAGKRRQIDLSERHGGNPDRHQSGKRRRRHFHFTDNFESATRRLEGIGQRHRAEYPDDSRCAGWHEGICQSRAATTRDGFYKLISKASRFPAPIPITPNKLSASIPRPPMWPTWKNSRSDVLTGLGKIAASPGRGCANDAQSRDPSHGEDGEA